MFSGPKGTDQRAGKGKSRSRLALGYGRKNHVGGDLELQVPACPETRKEKARKKRRGTKVQARQDRCSP
jgi:hypothetical protein